MEQKLNSGALFKNDKGDNPNRPDYTGIFKDSSGNDLRLSAWVKKDKNGNNYMSLSAQPKENNANVEKQAHASKPQYEEKSDLPF